MKADYNSISEDWKKQRQKLPEKDGMLFEAFINGIPDKSNILDLGCGNGVPVAQLLSTRGFQVTGIDYSTNLLEQARTNLPNIRFEQSDIENYEISETYDGIVLWDVLFHLPRKAHQPLLSKIYAALPQNGLFIVSSGGSDNDLPPFTDFMFGVEFHYDSYPVNEFISICENIGFTVTNFEVVNTPNGERDKGRIGVVLSKA